MDARERAEALEVVEHLVDHSSVRVVLALLDEVCGLKATHLVEAWQDSASARAWLRAGRVVETAAQRVEV